MTDYMACKAPNIYYLAVHRKKSSLDPWNIESRNRPTHIYKSICFFSKLTLTEMLIGKGYSFPQTVVKQLDIQIERNVSQHLPYTTDKN